jgi:hypothetical protein
MDALSTGANGGAFAALDAGADQKGSPARLPSSVQGSDAAEPVPNGPLEHGPFRGNRLNGVHVL